MHSALSLPQRFLFRWLLAYSLLYTLPFPLDRLPYLGDSVGEAVRSLWTKAGVWFGQRVVGIEGEIYTGTTGSGDTTLAYLLVALVGLVSLAIAVVWSLVDRQPRNYRRAGRWLALGVSFYLGVVMLEYGFAKLIPSQFPRPSLHRLLTPYGDSSPMGLVWTFMGQSPVYTVFAGAGEAFGGLLLFFRRTRTLGAAVLTAVMTNVVMINYCYDVPVKLYSSHLLAMAIGLLLLERRRLIDFFLRSPGGSGLGIASRRGRLALAAFGVLLVGTVIYTGIERSGSLYREYGDGRDKPDLWGIHEVVSFVAEGAEVPPLLTDENRWRALVIDWPRPMSWGGTERPGMVTVQNMDGRLARHRLVFDEGERTMTFLPPEAASLQAVPEDERALLDVLRWRQPESGILELIGRWRGQAVEIRLATRALDEMELPGRGFHWINEFPRNR
ncbi:MAG: hypothetical protein AAF604_10860 [Acidobacteriota bacterium]